MTDSLVTVGAADGRDQEHALAAEILQLLISRGQTLATAESLTGGLVCATLTSVAGSSAAVRGGLAAYASDLKSRVLGVDAELIERYGVVSGQVAAAMARCAHGLFDSTWAVATTGVAGPDQQDGRPVGTVFVAVSGPGAEGGVGVEELALAGDRETVRRETVRAVLRQLRGRLADDPA